MLHRVESGDVLFTTKTNEIFSFDINALTSHILDENIRLINTGIINYQISEFTANTAATKVSEYIAAMGLTHVHDQLVRELTACALESSTIVPKNETDKEEYINFCRLYRTVSLPMIDNIEIDIGTGGRHDNANLQENAETSHKRKADILSKHQYLATMPQKIQKLHTDGMIHIHDLEYFGTRPFCQDWDLRYFFYYGLMPDGQGTKASVAGPAKRPEVAILHAVKALGSAQTNFAGGQGYYNFLTFLAPYFEGMEYADIEHHMQMFVYEMTQMMVARGGQIVFSSIQLTPGVPKLWKDKPVVFKGKIWNGKQAPHRTYSEFEGEVRLLFKALMEVMYHGDYFGKPFMFPKPEISIEPQFMEEDEKFNASNPDMPTYKELYKMSFALAARHGTPYFDNQLPPYRGAGEGISCYQCCAYQFSKNMDNDSDFEDKLYFKDGMHFSMGSWCVTSFNAPRAAYLAQKDDEILLEILKEFINLCTIVFEEKRKWMNLALEHNRIPFAQQRPVDPINNQIRGPPAVDFDGLVYTIGIVGLNEMILAHTGHQMHEDKSSWAFALTIMLKLKTYVEELSKEKGYTIALARTPAETTGQRFAVKDLQDDTYCEYAKQFVQGDVEYALANISNTTDLPVYYTNGTHVPPNANISIGKRIETEHVFFPIVDGGNILHIWTGEHSPSPEGLMDIAMNMCKNTQVGYFAFTRDLTLHLNRYKLWVPKE